MFIKYKKYVLNNVLRYFKHMCNVFTLVKEVQFKVESKYNAHALNGGRHLHEIFNGSIIFMSHFSIGMIDIHKKICLRNFFKIQNGRCRWGPKTEKIFRSRLLKNNFLQSFTILHVASLGVTLGSEPTIS